MEEGGNSPVWVRVQITKIPEVETSARTGFIITHKTVQYRIPPHYEGCFPAIHWKSMVGQPHFS